MAPSSAVNTSRLTDTGSRPCRLSILILAYSARSIPASWRSFSTSSSGGGVAGNVIRTEAPDGRFALNVPPRSPAAELSAEAEGDCSGIDPASS